MDRRDACLIAAPLWMLVSVLHPVPVGVVSNALIAVLFLISGLRRKN